MIYTIENEAYRVRVNSLGAELWSVLDKRENRECLWQGNPEIWPRRAPNLFPVCGRLHEGTAYFSGKGYSIPLHGFLRDYDHELVYQSQDVVRFRMCDGVETRGMYPFSFCVETEFVLDDQGLKQTFFVTNTGHEELPFSIGYHTGWRCPFDAAHSIKDYQLVFEKEETVDRILNENLIVSGREPYLQEENIIGLQEGLLTPNIVLQNLQSRWVRIEEKDSGRFIQIGIRDFPNVVFWSVPEKMPFVCVEPWHGLFEPAEKYGEFVNKPFLEKLEPGKTFSCCMTVAAGTLR